MCAKLHKNWIKTVGGLAIWKKRFMTDIQTYTSHHKYKVCWLQANNTLHGHFPSLVTLAVIWSTKVPKESFGDCRSSVFTRGCPL